MVQGVVNRSLYGNRHGYVVALCIYEVNLQKNCVTLALTHHIAPHCGNMDDNRYTLLLQVGFRADAAEMTC